MERYLGNEDKKSLIRTLVSRVILKRTQPCEIEVKVVWISRNVSILKAYPPIFKACDVNGYEEMVKLVKELYEKGMNDQAICEELNSKGFRSARLRKVYPRVVQKIRITEGLYSISYKFQKEEIFDGYMTIKGLSKKLGVSIQWVHSRIKSGKIKPMRHPVTGNYLVEDSPKLMEYLLKLKEKSLSRSRKVGDKTISMR